MIPYYETPDGRAKLYLGDSRHLPIEDESIDMIATSPPYWGKRDYGEDVVAVWGDGWEGQLGLEPTWQEYISHLCECAEEWWRVLKPMGNLFVNMGDTFWGGSSGKNFDSDVGSTAQSTRPGGGVLGGAGFGHIARVDKGGIPKMKLGIPYRFRFALNDMGWVSRDDIPWYKGKEYLDGRISKTAMPESVKRRFACSYEMVFRFVKTPKMNYYVNERTLQSRDRPPKQRIEGQDFEWREHAKCEGKGCDSPRCKDGLIKYSFWHGVDQWFDLDAVRRPHKAESHERYRHAPQAKPRSWKSEECPIDGGIPTWRLNVAGANPGDVWIIQPEPFKEKHYACWPSKLCERMIKVGCPKEVCSKCGRPRERFKKTLAIEDHPLREDRNVRNVQFDGEGYSESEGTLGKVRVEETIGWSDCGCGEGFVPGVIVDPFFGGSWRLAKEALKLGRNIIGIDMKEEYLEMAKDMSIYGEKGLSKEKARRKEGATQGVLL